MGCGSSSAKGRDKYATLSPDTEPLTPLVHSEPEELPRLNSFITPLPPETPPEEKKPIVPVIRASPLPPPKSPRKKTTPVSPIKPPPDSYTKSTPPVSYTAAGRSPSKSSRSKVTKSTTTNTTTASSTPDAFPVSADPSFEFRKASIESFQNEVDDENESPAPPSLAPPSLADGIPIQPPPLLINPASSQPTAASADPLEGPPAVVEPKEKRKKKRKSKTSKSMSSRTSSSGTLHDTPTPNSTSGMRFDELYRLKGVLGTGAFSTVREGYHRSSTSYTYAVKCVNRKKLTEEDEAALLDEVAILKELKHMHIIRLYDFFVESSTYYLVMERMSGGELFDRIVAKAYYNEKEARDVCKIVLEAVGYCHNNQVAHRDLKPENLLLLSEDDDSTVKIADFGFAKKVYAPQSLTTQCGTPGYVAPEILEGTPYDYCADMWSVGVILYILLGGYPPFIENNQRDLFRKIRRGEYEFHEEYWGTVSQEAKDLISSLLTVDPKRRLTAQQALDNSWIRENDAELARKDLGKNLQALTSFNAKRKFKAAVSTVMAVNKLQSLGKDFLKNLS